MCPYVLHSHGPAALFGHKLDHPLRARKRPVLSGPPRFSLVGLVCVLLDAHYLLDLLGQGLLLFFLLSPTTLMVLMPLASFFLHQPNLGDPARLFLEVVALLVRVAHWRSPPSTSTAPLA